jgi:hypothetical protein
LSGSSQRLSEKEVACGQSSEWFAGLKPAGYMRLFAEMGRNSRAPTRKLEKGAAAGWPRRGENLSRKGDCRLADDLDGFFDVAMSLVDVLEGASLQTLGEPIVFFLGNIVVRLVQ